MRHSSVVFIFKTEIYFGTTNQPTNQPTITSNMNLSKVSTVGSEIVKTKNNISENNDKYCKANFVINLKILISQPINPSIFQLGLLGLEYILFRGTVTSDSLMKHF